MVSAGLARSGAPCERPPAAACVPRTHARCVLMRTCAQARSSTFLRWLQIPPPTEARAAVPPSADAANAPCIWCARSRCCPQPSRAQRRRFQPHRCPAAAAPSLVALTPPARSPRRRCCAANAFWTFQRRRVPALTLVPAQLVLATLSRPRRPCSGRFRRRRRTPDTPLAGRCAWPLLGPVGVVVSRVSAQRVFWCVPIASYDTPTTSPPRGGREGAARAVPGPTKS